MQKATTLVLCLKYVAKGSLCDNNILKAELREQ